MAQRGTHVTAQLAITGGYVLLVGALLRFHALALADGQGLGGEAPLGTAFALLALTGVSVTAFGAWARRHLVAAVAAAIVITAVMMLAHPFVPPRDASLGFWQDVGVRPAILPWTVVWGASLPPAVLAVADRLRASGID